MTKTVLLALASTTLLTCLLHYYTLAILFPEKLIRLIDGRSSICKWGYMLAVFIAACAFLLAGFLWFFSWMPASWGMQDEDGSFMRSDHKLAGLLAFAFVFPILQQAENYARHLLELEESKLRIKELEDDLRSLKRQS